MGPHIHKFMRPYIVPCCVAIIHLLPQGNPALTAAGWQKKTAYWMLPHVSLLKGKHVYKNKLGGQQATSPRHILCLLYTIWTLMLHANIGYCGDVQHTIHPINCTKMWIHNFTQFDKWLIWNMMFMNLTLKFKCNPAEKRYGYHHVHVSDVSMHLLYI